MFSTTSPALFLNNFVKLATILPGYRVLLSMSEAIDRFRAGLFTNPGPIYTPEELDTRFKEFIALLPSFPLEDIETCLLHFERCLVAIRPRQWQAAAPPITPLELINTWHNSLFKALLRNRSFLDTSFLAPLRPNWPFKKFSRWYRTTSQSSGLLATCYFLRTNHSNVTSEDIKIITTLLEHAYPTFSCHDVALTAFTRLEQSSSVKQLVVDLCARAHHTPATFAAALLTNDPSHPIQKPVREMVLSSNLSDPDTFIEVGGFLCLPVIRDMPDVRTRFTSTASLATQMAQLDNVAVSPVMTPVQYSDLVSPLILGLSVYPQGWLARLRVVTEQFIQRFPNAHIEQMLGRLLKLLLSTLSAVGTEALENVDVTDTDLLWFYAVFPKLLTDPQQIQESFHATRHRLPPLSTLSSPLVARIMSSSHPALRALLFSELRTPVAPQSSPAATPIPLLG